MENKANRLTIITSLIMGILLGATATSQLLDLGSPVYLVLVGFVVLSICGFLLTNFLLKRLAWYRFFDYSLKTRFAWLSLCIIAGFFLVFTLPITVYPKPQVLEIVALGEKNSQSKGSEVWLHSIVTGQSVFPIYSEACKGKWVLIKDSLVSVQESQPSNLVCTIKTDDDITVQLGVHEWSGKVRIVYRDQIFGEDLFSETSASKLVRIDVTLSRLEKVIWLFLFITNGLTLGFMLFAVSFWLVNKPSASGRVGNAKSTAWYWYALVLAGTWLLYLLIFWPGFLSPDTITQFKQIESGQYRDWHPVFHTLMLWLTTRIWFSTVPAVIIQIAALSGLLGWGISMGERSGTPRWLSWIITAFLAVTPAVSLVLLHTWKDVAFGISVAALSLLIFYLVLVKGEQTKTTIAFWILLGLIAALVALFRHNGPLVAFGTLIFLLLVNRRNWKWISGVILLSTLVWLGVRGPFYTTLRVIRDPETKGENLVGYSAALYLLKTHMVSGTNLLPEEEAILSDIYQEDGTIRLDALGRNSNRILQSAISASIRNPLVAFRYFLGRASFVFQILQSPHLPFGFVDMTIRPNTFGFVSNSKIPFLAPIVTKITMISESPYIDWLIWRNAFWMYLMIFSASIASVRLKSWKVFAIIMPVILNALPYVIMGSSQSRYLLPTLILGPLIGPGLLFLQSESLPMDCMNEMTVEPENMGNA